MTVGLLLHDGLTTPMRKPLLRVRGRAGAFESSHRQFEKRDLLPSMIAERSWLVLSSIRVFKQAICSSGHCEHR